MASPYSCILLGTCALHKSIGGFLQKQTARPTSSPPAYLIRYEWSKKCVLLTTFQVTIMQLVQGPH